MRKLGILGGLAATALGATVVMAASPAPSATPAPKPTATPAPIVTPAPTATPAPKAITPGQATSPAATTGNGWTATVAPLTLQGKASFVKNANGSATLTMAMQGLDPTAAWTVTVMRGGTGSFETRPILFRWSKNDVDRLGSGTLRVHLTAAEYRSIAHARTADGLVILVSDGAREAFANFAKQ